MAARRGLWAELQRDHAHRQRLEQQALRAAARAAAQAQQEDLRRRRAEVRRATADERERKRLYAEDRKAEAAALTAEIQTRLSEIDSVLIAGIGQAPPVSFISLKRMAATRPFDAGGLDQRIARPEWAQFAPKPPSAFGRAFGGTGRYQKEEAAAREEYEREVGNFDRADADRRRRLAQRRRAYEVAVAQETREVAQYNDSVEQFERDFHAGDPEAVDQYVTLCLDASVYPEDFPHRTRVLYRPDPKEIVVEYELPPQSVVPVVRDFKYVHTRDQIDSVARAAKEVKELYARLIAKVALRTIHEVLTPTSETLVELVTFNGHVSTKDQATGQPVRPCLISVSAPRKLFRTFVLADLDPVACLRKLNALVSNHPYDFEAVRPVVDFEVLLSQYKFVEGMDAVAGLDSRPDLIEMTPTEFEHFVRQLFEAMGMKSWVTQASKDDGVDAVAVNDAAVFGGLCVIQAKRYRNAVGVEPMRALAGVMEDKHATKGIMVTTSWVTKDGHAFAQRHGRIEVFEGEELKYLCQEYLDRDVLIGLPKPPPARRKPV